jgi:hypothetical protein
MKNVKNKVTVGQLLDLIDNTRESEDIIRVMDGYGGVEASIKICSSVWKGIEDKEVNSIRINGNSLEIWLEDWVYEG